MTSSAPDATAYRALPYLDRGDPYPAVALADPGLRRSSYSAGLSATQSERVERLLRENPIVSFHDHPQLLPADMAEVPAYVRTRQIVPFDAIAGSGLTAVFDNWFGILGTWRWEDLLAWLGTRQAEVARRDDVVVARTVRDILDAQANDQLALVLGAESATSIENELDRIDILYGFGVRQLGLVYAESNALGSGQKEAHDGGLTTFGRRAVARMNDLGILIDVSHASDRTSLEAIEASSAPVGITHAGARAVWPIPRLKSDDVLRACAERGGVLGLEAAPHTTISLDHRTHSIESLMDHFRYSVDLMGIEHVAFGPDTLFGDHVGFHHATGAALGLSTIFDPGDVEFDRVPYVDGVENPAESFRNIAGWLVAHDYSDSEIQAVLGGNILRLLKEVWR